MRLNGQSGFSLLEMIVVIVITGILGSMAAVFIKMPVQQYMDVARRADLADIANLALSRLESDIRSALPHSARATSGTCPVTSANPGGTGTCSFLEILPSSGSGRYRNGTGGTGDILTIGVADTSFEVLGAMPAFASGDQVIVTDNTVAAAYAGNYRTPWVSTAAPIVTITSIAFPAASPSARFHIINQAVSHVCDPSVGGTLIRYSYAIQAAQPTTAAVLGTARLLANNVSSCGFGVTQGNSLVAISLGVSKSSEVATLYKVVHVSNEP
ncbi:MAG: type II secretion system protein [Gallionella sp.]|nr:type II secretion system protein [Gallionella sp.]